MFSHPKFEVEITIERVTHIPYYSGSVFVRWNVVDSPRPDAHGRTVSRPITNTEANFKYHTRFKQRIGLRTPSKLLKNCNLKLEVVWEPAGGRGVTIGQLTLDLAQFAKASKPGQYEYQDDLEEDQINITHDDNQSDQHNHNHHNHEHSKNNKETQPKDPHATHSTLSIGEVYDKQLLYLLSGAKNNSLLNLKVKLDHVSGENDFRVPAFDGPAVNLAYKADPDLHGKEPSNLKSPSGNRAKLRRLREAVLEDLLSENHSRNNTESDWLDIDQFLLGKHIKAVSKERDSEFEKYGIRDVADVEFENHKPGTPYLETEVRDNFINWNIAGF